MPPSHIAPCSSRLQVLSSACVYFMFISTILPCLSPASCPISTTCHCPQAWHYLKAVHRLHFPRKASNDDNYHFQNPELPLPRVSPDPPDSTRLPSLPRAPRGPAHHLHYGVEKSALQVSHPYEDTRGQRGVLSSLSPRLTIVAGKQETPNTTLLTKPLTSIELQTLFKQQSLCCIIS